MLYALNALKYGLTQVDAAATYVADRVVSAPQLDKDLQDKCKAAEVAAAGGVTYGLGCAGTVAGVALTESLAAAGASTAAIQAAAALAAGSTEVAAGGLALASASGGVMAVGAAILFSGLVAAKVGVRGIGHLYNNHLNQQPKVDQQAATEQLAKAPRSAPAA